MSKYGYTQHHEPKLCAICGSNQRVEQAHITAKGFGGRGKKAPAGAHDTIPLCAGTGGNTDNRSCHHLQEYGHIRVRIEDGNYIVHMNPHAVRTLSEKIGIDHLEVEKTYTVPVGSEWALVQI